MNESEKKELFTKDSKFLLALHSSTNTFGIGLAVINKSEILFKSSTIEIKQDLANYLFNLIEEILPSMFWNQITRLAIATGPGGYTGTRISVIFARTLAQQLNCPIDGISSFQLMAYRIAKKFSNSNSDKTFWIKHTLKRRGIVAGQYKILQDKDESLNLEVEELKIPHLIPSTQKISPAFDISENIKQDINELLRISLNYYNKNQGGEWEDILPIYPTSPIEK